jgi:hypothetical protein
MIVCDNACLKSAVAMVYFTASSSLIEGSSGKSSASTPLITDWYVPELRVMWAPFVDKSTVPFGRLLTNSLTSRAGRVMAPCFTILAPM